MSPITLVSPARAWLATAGERIDRLSPRTLGALAMLAAGSALGLALASEYWGGLLPCSLCLLERWPYRIAILLGALAVVAPRTLVRPLIWLIAATMLVNVGLALIHVGVEQHLWQNPIADCAAPAVHGSVMDRLLQLSGRPPQPCDRASYLIPFLPLSMAAMNALYALAIAGVLAAFLVRHPRAS